MADKIKVWRDEAGKWRWTKHAGGNEARTAVSGESFDSKRNAVEAAWREAAGTDATVEVSDGQVDN